MSDQSTFKPRFLQIARVDAKNKILDITDPSPRPVVFNPKEEDENGRRARAPRYELNYSNYGENLTITHKHWVDFDTLRLLAWYFKTGYKGEKDEKGNYRAILMEFKGTEVDRIAGKELSEKKLVSRKLTVQYTEALTKIGPCYQVSFLVQDGQRGDKGQVTPVSNGETYLKENINIPFVTARMIGCRVGDYLVAKEAAAIMRHSFDD